MIKILIFFVFVGCQTNSTPKPSSEEHLPQRPSTPINNKRLVQQLLNSALMYGNEKAYNEVASYYFIEDMEQDFLYYALTMANKYNSSEAYYHVYSIIAKSTPEEANDALQHMDDKSRNFALYYLLRSCELGFEKSKYEIVEIFGKDQAVPNSSFYRKKFCEGQ
jgi:hypothetical protein